MDSERGRVVADELRALGVRGVLITAAERGHITELACGMPECFCPEELGGASHFVARTRMWNDWEPTLEHFPIPKREGGRKSVDNAVLAHRLCNKLDYFKSQGLSIEKDLARVEKAREEAIRNAQSPPRVRYERFNSESIYVVGQEPTDALSLHSPEPDEPQT